MLITCPKCESKARIATPNPLSKETCEVYCQYLNLSCGLVCTTLTIVNKIIYLGYTLDEPFHWMLNV
ncbi:ogr/Delta-like zinc finger family protein [Vibrio sp. HN007]|uniref:ogr/Delta-like zinc finger family protein n=1 Tax=Vibrio iocasae TaxID=3098914 RepID=UPI0035D3ED94